MSAVIYTELRVFLIFVLHGACLLFCSDLLRSLRLALPHSPLWIGLEDVLFWFLAAIWTFVLIFLCQDGALRLYMAAAAGLGMILYRRTLSPWVVRAVSGLLGLVFRCIFTFVHKSTNFVGKLLLKISKTNKLRVRFKKGSKGE